MKISRVVGTTNEILQIFIRDSSSTIGAGLTGLTNASSGLTAYYNRNDQGTPTAISLVSMTLGTYTSGGFKELDATNMPGWYQFCPPSGVFTSGRSVALHLKGATNMAPLPIEVELTVVNNQSAGFGLVDASANVVQWNGTNVAAPATAGIPEVNVKNMNNVSAASVTTVSANQGTTQPVNFTGTGASALVKSDAEAIGTDVISAAAVSAGAGNKIADFTIRRNSANARASANGDTVAFRSILGGMSKLTNRVQVNGANLDIYDETDAGTPFGVQAITATPGADPITELDTT